MRSTDNINSSLSNSLRQLTSTDVRARGRDLLIVPVGATEQHGPHLPLSTDSDIALALAVGVADRLGEITIAPTVSYGASDEHRAFKGTLSIGTGPMTELLLALGRSASRSWSRVLFLNAHGGNFDALREAVSTLRAEGRDVRAWSPSWGGDRIVADAHAGHTETSVMLALRPDTVRMERATPGAREPLAALIGTMQVEGVHAVSESGVLGDPSNASAASGEALLADAIAALVEFVGAWCQAVADTQAAADTTECAREVQVKTERTAEEEQ